MTVICCIARQAESRAGAEVASGQRLCRGFDHQRLGRVAWKRYAEGFAGGDGRGDVVCHTWPAQKLTRPGYSLLGALVGRMWWSQDAWALGLQDENQCSPEDEAVMVR